MNRETPSPLTLPPKPLFVVLSGLSGAGKDAVLAGLRLTDLSLFISVSATTRTRRAGEKDGFDYHFVTSARFQELIDSDQLLEWANVYGKYYGIPKEPVRQALRNGKDVIVKIDVQGAATIKKILPQAVFIFMVTPYMEELERRLKERRTETSDDVELRLKTAVAELRQLPMFDYVVVNRPGEINEAVADIVAIIKAEKCRVAQRELAI
jgi:guanylate kinase